MQCIRQTSLTGVLDAAEGLIRKLDNAEILSKCGARHTLDGMPVASCIIDAGTIRLSRSSPRMPLSHMLKPRRQTTRATKAFARIGI
jgi:hypothetical protein